jgi:DNA-binding transcriptional regulator YiaG
MVGEQTKGDGAMPDLEYADAERIRARLGFTKVVFCRYLRVSRMQYHRWKQIGIAGPAQQVLKLMEKEPGRTVEVLMEG